MEFKKQVFNDGDFRIIFEEDEDYALIRLKNGEDYFLAISIHVMKKYPNGNEDSYAWYLREFDKIPNVAHVSRFIDKFLSDKEYRKQFLINGESWDGEIKVPNPKDSVNPRCVDAIRSLQSKKENKLRFKDFASLKTYGTDKYSRMKMDELAGIIGEDIAEAVKQALPDSPSLQLPACRWIARGLKFHLAIRKVKTDAEIADNARAKEKGWES